MMRNDTCGASEITQYDFLKRWNFCLKFLPLMIPVFCHADDAIDKK